MTSARRVRLEEAFRAAVEARDLSGAETALRNYITWFMSASRNLQEIESARDLLIWGISVTSAGKVQMAEELMRLRTVLDAYLPRRRTQTWRVIG